MLSVCPCLTKYRGKRRIFGSHKREKGSGATDIEETKLPTLVFFECAEAVAYANMFMV
jgi:hypothetical protein